MTSFTNLRVLHVTNAPLQHEQIRLAYETLGSTVSHLLLEGCPMDIYLHSFTNLEDLAILDPRYSPVLNRNTHPNILVPREISTSNSGSTWYTVTGLLCMSCPFCPCPFALSRWWIVAYSYFCRGVAALTVICQRSTSYWRHHMRR